MLVGELDNPRRTCQLNLQMPAMIRFGAETEDEV